MYLNNCKIEYNNISDNREVDIYRAVEYLQKRAPSDSYIKFDIDQSTSSSNPSVTGTIKVASRCGMFCSKAEGRTLKNVLRELTNATEEKISYWRLHRCFKYA